MKTSLLHGSDKTTLLVLMKTLHLVLIKTSLLVPKKLHVWFWWKYRVLKQQKYSICFASKRWVNVFGGIDFCHHYSLRWILKINRVSIIEHHINPSNLNPIDISSRFHIRNFDSLIESVGLHIFLICIGFYLSIVKSCNYTLFSIISRYIFWNYEIFVYPKHKMSENSFYILKP